MAGFLHIWQRATDPGQAPGSVEHPGSDLPCDRQHNFTPLIVIFFGGFALAVQGLDRWVALSLVRLGRGRFLPVAALVFCGTAFLSMWMSNSKDVISMRAPIGGCYSCLVAACLSAASSAPPVPASSSPACSPQ